jgi:hypothetical protein
MILKFLHFFRNFNELMPGGPTPIYAEMRSFTRIYDVPLHTERTRKWLLHQARVRLLACPGAPLGTLCKRELPKTRGRAALGYRDGGPDRPRRDADVGARSGHRHFGDLVDLHIADMCEVAKAPGRSKDATLAMLKRELGKLRMTQLDRELIVQFGRTRAAQGAGPVTVAMDIGAIRLVLSHAAAVHGLPVSIEQIDLGRIALKRLGLVGKSNQRNRRPTDDELAKLIAHFDGDPRQLIPMGRIKFAVATAMRQEEICRVTWSDLNERTKMLTIRDRTLRCSERAASRGVPGREWLLLRRSAILPGRRGSCAIRQGG